MSCVVVSLPSFPINDSVRRQHLYLMWRWLVSNIVSDCRLVCVQIVRMQHSVGLIDQRPAVFTSLDSSGIPLLRYKLCGLWGKCPTAVILSALTFPFPGSHNGFPQSFSICSGSRSEMGLCVEGFHFLPVLPSRLGCRAVGFQISFLGALIRLRLRLGRSKILAFFAVSHSDAVQAELQSLSCWETLCRRSLAAWERFSSGIVPSPRPSCTLIDNVALDASWLPCSCSLVQHGQYVAFPCFILTDFSVRSVFNSVVYGRSSCTLSVDAKHFVSSVQDKF